MSQADHASPQVVCMDTHGSEHEGHWLPLAVVHSLVGALLGLLTAGLLVVLSLKVFTDLADVDYDLGLRMERLVAERVDNFSTGMEPVKKKGEATDSYLFLDVDPQVAISGDMGGSRESHLACAALQAKFPDRFALTTGAGEEKPAAKGSGRTVLDCGEDRPVNRYLLAELIPELQRRGARVIVLDVVVSGERSAVSLGELEALRKVLQQPRGKQVPVLYVTPAEYDIKALQSGGQMVRLGEDGIDRKSVGLVSMAAVALPAPTQPLRRYARCFATHGEAAGIPSLPYLASYMMEDPSRDPSKACTSSRPGTHLFEAPRVHYTLPSLRSHQDATGNDEDFRLWSIYRNVYNRCTVSNLWSADSECSTNAMVAGKMVVIGASNPARRDRHYTPLGDMAGAEVVINAARSFALFDEQDKTVLKALEKKAYIVFICTLVWFAFFCVKGILKPPKDASIVTYVGRSLAVGLTFCLALTTVLLLTFKLSFLSLSVLVGVLAVGLEQYVELVNAWVIHPFERGLKCLFKLPMGH